MLAGFTIDNLAHATVIKEPTLDLSKCTIGERKTSRQKQKE